jgi:hypothetical protein
MKLRVVAALLGGTIAGASVIAIVFLTGKGGEAPGNAMTIEEAGRWEFSRDGVRVSDLRISGDHEGLTHTAPGVGVRITNRSREVKIVGVFVTMHDDAGELVASVCLKPSEIGLAAPGETKNVVEMLPVPRADIERVSHVRIRVTHATVHRQKGRGTTVL